MVTNSRVLFPNNTFSKGERGHSITTCECGPKAAIDYADIDM